MGLREETSKPIWETVTHTSSSSSSYALNGKIMLSSVIILFLAVIMILCFHTYARWLFRRQNRRIRRRIRAHLRSLSSTISSSSALSPLDPSVLEKIPIFLYNSETPLEECSVCLSEFEEGDEGRLLCVGWAEHSPLSIAPPRFKAQKISGPILDTPVSQLPRHDTSSSTSAPTYEKMTWHVGDLRPWF